MNRLRDEIKLSYRLLSAILLAFISLSVFYFLLNHYNNKIQLLYKTNTQLLKLFKIEDELLRNIEKTKEGLIDVQIELKKLCMKCHAQNKLELINTREKIFSEALNTKKIKNDLTQEFIILSKKLLQDNMFLISSQKSLIKNTLVSLEYKFEVEKINYLNTIFDIMTNLSIMINELNSLNQDMLLQQDINLSELSNKINEIINLVNNFYPLTVDPINYLILESIMSSSNKTKTLLNNLVEIKIKEQNNFNSLSKNKQNFIEILEQKILMYNKLFHIFEKLLALLTFLIILLSLFFICKIIKRFNKMETNIKNLINETVKMQKDHSHTIKIEDIQYEEIDILIMTMNDLSKKITNIINNLNQTIDEKTKELKLKNEQLIQEIQNKDQAQKELLAIKNNLENLVSERTKELHKSNLELINEIKKRKEAEIQMLKLINAIEHSPVSIVITDKNSIIEYVNPKFTEVTLYQKDEVIGKPISIIKSGIHTKEFYEQMWNTLLSKKVWSGEICNKKKNGELFWEYANISPVLDENGEISYFVAVKEDITYKKQMESEKLKMEKLEALALLTSGIAHDFNNILTTILGNITLSQRLLDKPEKLKSKLENIEKACEKASNLIQQLKTFAKSTEPAKKEINIRRIIEDASLIALSGSTIKFQIIQPEPIWSIYADPTQIEQVFTNLLLNARQAIQHYGEITVSITNVILKSDNEYSLKEGNYLKIKVTDNGIGIPPEYINKIFDPYFTTKPQGTGLGLATTYSIIKKHDGAITVTSQLGKGTTFTILLPATGKIIEHEEYFKKENLQFNENDIQDEPAVLIMDDDILIQETLKDMLQTLNFSVTITNNGEQAIKEFEKQLKKNNPYKIVFLDLTIPGSMGGKETILKLKEIYPNFKAILISGYVQEPIISNFKELGFDMFIPKPFTFSDIENAVKLLS